MGRKKNDNLNLRGRAGGLGLVLLLLLGGAGCSDEEQSSSEGGGGNGGGEPADLRTQVLVSLADDVLIPTYGDFAAAAGQLREAAAAYAGSLEQADLEAARQAWRDAMEPWQRAEALEVGPAAPAVLSSGEERPGGRDLGDLIDSWPVTKPCFIDQRTAEGAPDAETLRAETVNVRGLDAIEYLLFVPDTENQCSPQSAINAEGTWDALGDDEIRSRRAAYATAAAELVVDDANQLDSAWKASGDDFRQELVTAGRGSDTFSDQLEAFNLVFTAMMYLDRTVKDMKLAVPAGISPECRDTTCPNSVESPYAQASVAHLRNNLLGFQRAFLGAPAGTDAPGFDDLLRDAGAADLATRMTDNIEAAVAAIEAIEGDSLVEALEQNLESVEAAHAAVKAVTDDLKSQFPAVLGLQDISGMVDDGD